MVRIEKDKMLFEFVEVDSKGKEKRRAINVLESSLGLASYLTFPVSVAEDVTVSDVMKFLSASVESSDFVFDSSLGGHSLVKFLDEINQEMDAEPNLDFMEIAHEVDLVDENGILESIPRMRAVGKDGAIFSVEFSPVPCYKNFPIRLNKQYVIRTDKKDGKEPDVMILQKEFTVFEFFHSILYEMSYYGDAEDRNSSFENLMDMSLEPETKIELKERDEVEILKKDLQRLIDKEDYEQAADIRDRLKKLLDDKNKTDK